MTQPTNLPLITENGVSRTMTEAEYAEYIDPANKVKELIPFSVTMRQARLALLSANKLTLVSSAIDSLPSPQKEQAQIEWEYATTVSRDSALTQMLATSLGMSETDLDQLFTQAATL